MGAASYSLAKHQHCYDSLRTTLKKELMMFKICYMLIFLSVLPLMITNLNSAEKPVKQRGKQIIKSGGIDRFYYIVTPDKIKKDRALPLLIFLHGGGGHDWPNTKRTGGKIGKALRERLLGKTCMDIEPSEIIWKFFNKHIKTTTKTD